MTIAALDLGGVASLWPGDGFAARAVEMPRFSVVIFLELLALFAAAVWVYWELSRRSTARRHWAALSDWAGEHRFRFISPEGLGKKFPRSAALPPALAHLTNPAPAVGYLMIGGVAPGGLPASRQLWRWWRRAASLPAGGQNRQTGEVGDVKIFELDTPANDANSRNARWHVLTRQLGQSWPPTGLRPVGHPSSLIDFFALTSFPSLGSSQRFVMFGTEVSAARVLAQSPVRALLPADIGLLLHGNLMLLDFSARPFDPLELSRAIELSAQLARSLGEEQ